MIASRLRRTGGIVGRYGGDEFLVLFEPHHHVEGHTPEQMLRRALADAFVVDNDGLPLAVSASFGVAVYPDEAPNLATLVDVADAAMYRGRRQRRHTDRQEAATGPFGPAVGHRAA